MTAEEMLDLGFVPLELMNIAYISTIEQAVGCLMRRKLQLNNHFQ
jgi:hypothetical protein